MTAESKRRTNIGTLRLVVVMPGLEGAGQHDPALGCEERATDDGVNHRRLVVYEHVKSHDGSQVVLGHGGHAIEKARELLKVEGVAIF